MKRTYYDEYIYHMLRYYCITMKKQGGSAPTEFTSEISKNNWKAVDLVMSRLPKDDAMIIDALFNNTNNLTSNVERLCSERKLNCIKCYTLVSRVSNKVARARRLI